MAAIIANELIEDEILPSFSSSHNVKNKKSVWDIRSYMALECHIF